MSPPPDDNSYYGNRFPPVGSFWSVPAPTTHAETHDGCQWCLGTCTDHPAIKDPEIEKRRESLAGYDFNFPVEVPVTPSLPLVLATPGVHYRDVRYEVVEPLVFKSAADVYNMTSAMTILVALTSLAGMIWFFVS